MGKAASQTINTLYLLQKYVYPPVVEAIMVGMAMHTMSYMLLDQQKAEELRGEVEAQLVNNIQNMSRLHNEAIARQQTHE